MIDGFSKFVWIYSMKTTSTKKILNKLWDQQKTFGKYPACIFTDRGSAFTSDFKDYCTEKQIDYVLITTGVPRGNGQVERIHKIIIPILTKLSVDQPIKWYRFVNRVRSSINATYQKSVGMTPFEVLFGVKMRHKENIDILHVRARIGGLFNEELFNENRHDLRITARKNIQKIQKSPSLLSYTRKKTL